MTQVEDRGRCDYGGLRDMDGVRPSTTPPPPSGVQSFYEKVGQDNCGFKMPVLLHWKSVGSRPEIR